MPNWCTNEVDIYFPDECSMKKQLEIRQAINIPLVKDIYEEVDTDDWFSFEKIVPQPKHKKVAIEGKEPLNYKYVLENGEEFDWYDWNCDNWGTKWDRCDLEIIDNDKNSICMRFETAWGPPDGVHNKVREVLGDHAEMTWFYNEPGVEIAGYLR